MRQVVTTVLELVGFGCVVAGAWLVFFPAGLVVCGACLLTVGFLNAPGGDG